MWLRGKNLNVMRAIHRLQQKAIDELVVREHAILRDRFLPGESVNFFRKMAGDRFNAIRHFRAGATGRGKLFEEFSLYNGWELGVFVVREMPGSFIQ